MFYALLGYIIYMPLDPNRHLGPNTATMAYHPVQQTRQVTRLLLGGSKQQTRHLTRLLDTKQQTRQATPCRFAQTMSNNNDL